MRIATTGAFNRDADEDGEIQVAANIYDQYPCRPDCLADLTLFKFACDYEVVKTYPGPGAHRLQLSPTDVRWAKARLKKAIPRVYPHMTPESHGEEYFDCMLCLHMPWRNESEFKQTDLGVGGVAWPTYQAKFLYHEAALIANIDLHAWC